MTGSHEEILRRELNRERKARKEAERLLEQKSLEVYQRSQDLQREINERIRAEEKLQQKAHELERSNEELEQFAYAASHDLQAPLRSITGFSALLIKHGREKLDERAREYLNYVETSAKHLHSLINDLLEYARVGREAQNPSWTGACALVEMACAHLDSVLRESGAKVVYEGLPDVYGDPSQLVQLFQNLIGNGIKYSRKEVTPEVRIGASVQAGGWQFKVQDNGIGMVSSDIGRIFTIFQRLHTQEEYEGTGIGLSICKKIVERHGGRIWVESTPGRGSTFYFTLVNSQAVAAA